MGPWLEQAFRRRWFGIPEPLRGSIKGAMALILIDVVLLGSYIITIYLGAIWFVLCFVKRLPKEVGIKLAVIRTSIPVVTMLLVFTNFQVQYVIALEKGNRIAVACKKYRSINGKYPDRLDDLVPQYLSCIPVAKYCLLLNQFDYSPDRPTLYWDSIPFGGMTRCNIERGEWRYMD